MIDLKLKKVKKILPHLLYSKEQPRREMVEKHIQKFSIGNGKRLSITKGKNSHPPDFHNF